jgi:peptide deformylase
MILPITAFGMPILRKVATDINEDYPNLKQLIEDMWETMYSTKGIGLAAPQVNKSIRLFVVDSEQLFALNDEHYLQYPDKPGIKKIFINAHIAGLKGENWSYNEGCLSIPKIREDVNRPEEITLQYMDENFRQHTETFHGLSARIVQHEYDHIDGKLFIDHLKPLKRRMLQGKLTNISKGKIQPDYKMLFAK